MCENPSDNQRQMLSMGESGFCMRAPGICLLELLYFEANECVHSKHTYKTDSFGTAEQLGKEGDKGLVLSKLFKDLIFPATRKLLFCLILFKNIE